MNKSKIKKSELKEENTELLKVLGIRIRKIRLLLDLTQEDFARSLDITNTYLSEIESGRKNPKMIFFFKLIHYYRISLDYLFIGSGPIRLSKNRFREIDPLLIEDVHDIENMVLLMESSTLYRDNVMGFAGRFFLDQMTNIKKNIENLRRDKEEEDNDQFTKLSTTPPRKKGRSSGGI